MSEWVFEAEDARILAEGAALRKLEKTKQAICETIKEEAYEGYHSFVLDWKYFPVSCLEDWCNIYNWLLKLGYEVEDKSKRKYFVVKW